MLALPVPASPPRVSPRVSPRPVFNPMASAMSENFDKLLQQLAEQHQSEVNELREEVARLVAHMALNPAGARFRKSGEYAFDKEHTVLQSTVLAADKARVQRHIVNLGTRLHDPELEGAPIATGGPDADALAAAFAVAMDESNELEEVADLITGSENHQELALLHSSGGGGSQMKPSEAEFQSYIVPCSRESTPRERELPAPTEWWWDPKSSQQAHGGRWPPIGDEHQAAEVQDHAGLHVALSNGSVSIHEFNSENRRLTPIDAAARKESQRVMAQFSSSPGAEPMTALARWEKLINFAQTSDFLSTLPRLSPVWMEVAESDNDALTGFANLQGLVSKKSAAVVTVAPKEAEKRQPLLQRIMQPFMLHPTCRRRVCWDMCGITLLLHDLIFIPMQTAFDQGLGDGYTRNFLNVLDWVGAIFWSIDIVVSFLTGFYSAEGFVELGPPRVAKHYIKSWFPMDIMIVSIDWSAMFLGMSDASGFLRLGKTVSRIMRILRLLRFLKMSTTIKELMERINSEYLLQMMSLLKTLIFILIFNHYLACIWYGIGSKTHFTFRWPDKFLVNYPGSFWYAYSTALHWSLTQFTPASMEVVPQNPAERFYTIMVIVVALVAFSSFVSSITAAMTHMRQINARQVAEESAIRQFFVEHKVSHGTASRIWHFVRKNKGSHGRRMKETDVPALKAIPYKLKEDLRLEIYYPLLSVHPFFEEYYLRDKAALQKLCQVPVLTERTVPVGEELFRGQQIMQYMVFIALGQLQYIDCPQEGDFAKDDDELGNRVAYVAKGQWICEACLWAEVVQIFGPFYSYGGACEVVLIDAANFQRVVKDESPTLRYVIKYAQTFMTDFRDACISANADPEPEVQSSEADSRKRSTTPAAGSSGASGFFGATRLFGDTPVVQEEDPNHVLQKTMLFNEAVLAHSIVEKTKKELPETGRTSALPRMPFLTRMSTQ